MKKILLFGLAAAALLLGACSGVGGYEQIEALTLTAGEKSLTFTPDDLRGMESARAEFEGTIYVGVPLVELLRTAGLDPAGVHTVRASAEDGYSMSYGPEFFTRDHVLVAYAGAEGEMNPEDGTFRMVLPGERGRLNVRMLSELQVEVQ